MVLRGIICDSEGGCGGFSRLVYGENDELFLEKRDCLFMEFCAISRMGVRIPFLLQLGFEAVFFEFDLFGVC